MPPRPSIFIDWGTAYQGVCVLSFLSCMEEETKAQSLSNELKGYQLGSSKSRTGTQMVKFQGHRCLWDVVSLTPGPRDPEGPSSNACPKTSSPWAGPPGMESGQENQQKCANCWFCEVSVGWKRWKHVFCPGLQDSFISPSGKKALGNMVTSESGLPLEPFSIF